MKTHLACLFVAFATLVLPNLAHACGIGAVQFADDFKNPDPGWIHNDYSTIDSGVITLRPTVNKYYNEYNTSYIFGDADVCAQIKLNDFTKPEQLSGGLSFWITDQTNYYAFNIRPNGSWTIQRLVVGRWITISYGNSDAIKKGAGHFNEVEVQLSGKTGSAYVNGTKVASFNGQPPEAAASSASAAGRNSSAPTSGSSAISGS
jgi:hypothetical protein